MASAYTRDDSPSQQVDHHYQTEYAPTPSYSYSILSPLVYSTIAHDQPLEEESLNSQPVSSYPEKLPLLRLDQWDETRVYDEQPPSYIHYSIEWKVALNNRVVIKDTEQDLVLSPRYHWQLFLKPRLEKLLHKKFSSTRRVRSDDTNVVVSINDCSQRDLTRRFDGTDVDWPAIEKQLLLWGDLFRAGKKLRLSISFNYIEDSRTSGPVPRRGGKRGRTSVTNRMLAEREAQIDAEEGSCGQRSVWREVYNLMCCPGPPCRLGPHCWQDPEGKHYKLKTHHLRNLVKYAGVMQSHEDMPDMIR